MITLILSVFKVYLPVGLGISYVLGFDRKRLGDLLKFFIISTIVTGLATLIENAFQTTVINYVLVPFYIYLTLFHYAYSGSVYDIFLSPLFHILVEMYDDMQKVVAKERAKAKVLEENGKPYVSKQSKIQALIVDTLRPQNIYLLR